MESTKNIHPNLGIETMKILNVSYAAQSLFGPCVYTADYKLRRFIVDSNSVLWCLIHAFQRFLGYIIFLITLYFSYVHIYVLPNHSVAISYSVSLAIIIMILIQLLSVAIDSTYWKLGTALASYANANIKFMDHIYDAYNISKLEQDLDNESEKLLEQILRCISGVTVILLIIITTIAPVFYIQELWLTYQYAFTYPLERMLRIAIPIWFAVTNVCLFFVPGYWFMVLQCITRFCAGLQFMYVFAFQATRIISRIHMKVTSKLDNVENGITTYIGLFMCATRILSCLSELILPAFLIIALAVGSSTLFFSFGSRGPLLERIFAASVFLVATSCVSALTVLCGNLESESIKVLQEFKAILNHSSGMSDLNVLHKRLKPIREIRVQAGQTYYLHKISLVEFWDNVIDKTVFLLSAIPLY